MNCFCESSPTVLAVVDKRVNSENEKLLPSGLNRFTLDTTQQYTHINRHWSDDLLPSWRTSFTGQTDHSCCMTLIGSDG